MILTPTPQKKLIKIDSREDIIPEGALKKERALTGREDMTDLRRIKRPPKDKFLLFHSDSLAFMRTRNGSQKTKGLGSPPIGRPKYMNGSLPILHDRTVAASCIHDSSILTPNNMLL